MHPSRMCTVCSSLSTRISVQGVCVWGGLCQGDPTEGTGDQRQRPLWKEHGTNSQTGSDIIQRPTPTVDRQTPVNTLLCLKIRLRVEKTCKHKKKTNHHSNINVTSCLLLKDTTKHWRKMKVN